MSGSEAHEATNTGAARSLDWLGRSSRNHHINFAENFIAHLALFRVDAGSAGRAAIRTATVALLSRRELGVHVALAALEVDDLDLLHLLSFLLGMAPHQFVGHDLPELVKVCRCGGEPSWHSTASGPARLHEP